jgi:LysM repeat protein
VISVRTLFLLVLGLTCATLGFWLPADPVGAASIQQEGGAPSTGELIEAVNNLRLANGLNALNAHPILMQVAQAQADALAATGGSIGHNRPSGLSIEEQLILLGYPLSGDLSLGGYRSENWAAGRPGSTANDIVQLWLGDAPHTNTMLAEYRSDIGAGVTIGAEGQIYFVIDTALQTNSGQQQSSAGLMLTGVPMTQTALLGDATQAALSLSVNQIVIPVSRSTARPDGDVIHEVQNGQSLWSIAIAYEVKIAQIQSFNHLSDTTIYNGQKLLVQKDATQPPAKSETRETMTPTAPQLPTLTQRTATPTLTMTAHPDALDEAAPGSPIWMWLKLIGGVVLLVLTMHGLITWFSYRQKKKDT